MRVFGPELGIAIEVRSWKVCKLNADEQWVKTEQEKKNQDEGEGPSLVDSLILFRERSRAEKKRFRQRHLTFSRAWFAVSIL